MTRRDRWLRRIVLTVILVAGATASIATSKAPPTRLVSQWYSESLGTIDPALTHRARFCAPPPAGGAVRLRARVEVVDDATEGLRIPLAFTVASSDVTGDLRSGQASLSLDLYDVPWLPGADCSEWGTLTIKRPVEGWFRRTAARPQGLVRWRFEIETDGGWSRADRLTNVLVQVGEEPPVRAQEIDR